MKVKEIDNYEIDVSKIMKRGVENFKEIMGEVERIDKGKGMILIEKLKKVMIFEVMERKGLEEKNEKIGEGEWKVLF